LDSLYGEFDQYDQWFQQILPNLGLNETQFRYNNIYTDFGGTKNNSIAQEERFLNWLEEANMEDQLYWDNSMNFFFKFVFSILMSFVCL